jgi:hypothetical protein
MKSLIVFFSLLLANFIAIAQQKTDSIELYLKCRNDIMLSNFIPKYDPSTASLKIIGGRIIEQKDNNKIAVMPDSNVVIVQIYKKGKLSNTLTMYGRPTPWPFVGVRINGKEYSSSYSANGEIPRSIETVAEPDGNFRAFLPTDAQYRVTEWIVVLSRNDKELYRQSIRESRMPQTELSKLRSLARNRDKLAINIISVKRRNASGQMIPSDFEKKTITYTIQ